MLQWNVTHPHEQYKADLIFLLRGPRAGWAGKWEELKEESEEWGEEGCHIACSISVK